jgi:hypothetical protein
MSAMELRKLAARWKEYSSPLEPREDSYDMGVDDARRECAEQLEALLPAIERELNVAASGTRYYRGDGVEIFQLQVGTQNLVPERDALERGVGMGLAWVWKNTVSLSEDDAEMLKQADPAQIVK